MQIQRKQDNRRIRVVSRSLWRTEIEMAAKSRKSRKTFLHPRLLRTMPTQPSTAAKKTQITVNAQPCDVNCVEGAVSA